MFGAQSGKFGFFAFFLFLAGANALHANTCRATIAREFWDQWPLEPARRKPGHTIPQGELLPTAVAHQVAQQLNGLALEPGDDGVFVSAGLHALVFDLADYLLIKSLTPGLDVTHRLLKIPHATAARIFPVRGAFGGFVERPVETAPFASPALRAANANKAEILTVFQSDKSSDFTAHVMCSDGSIPQRAQDFAVGLPMFPSPRLTMLKFDHATGKVVVSLLPHQSDHYERPLRSLMSAEEEGFALKQVGNGLGKWDLYHPESQWFTDNLPLHETEYAFTYAYEPKQNRWFLFYLDLGGNLRSREFDPRSRRDSQFAVNTHGQRFDAIYFDASIDRLITISAGDGQVTLINPLTRKTESAYLIGRDWQSVAMSTGNVFWTEKHANELKIFKITEGGEAAPYYSLRDGRISESAFSLDAAQLLLVFRDGSGALLETASGKRIAQLDANGAARLLKAWAPWTMTVKAPERR